MKNIKTQYVTSDGTVFNSYREAEIYEVASLPEREYDVVLTIEIRTSVRAHSPEDACRVAEELWEDDDLPYESSDLIDSQCCD